MALAFTFEVRIRNPAELQRDCRQKARNGAGEADATRRRQSEYANHEPEPSRAQSCECTAAACELPNAFRASWARGLAAFVGGFETLRLPYLPTALAVAAMLGGVVVWLNRLEAKART